MKIITSSEPKQSSNQVIVCKTANIDSPILVKHDLSLLLKINKNFFPNANQPFLSLKPYSLLDVYWSCGYLYFMLNKSAISNLKLFLINLLISHSEIVQNHTNQNNKR